MAAPTTLNSRLLPPTYCVVPQVWAGNGWSVAGDAANQDMVYVAIFFAIGIGSLLCGLLRACVMVVGTVRASRILHAQLLSKILLLPMIFFDTQVGHANRALVWIYKYICVYTYAYIHVYVRVYIYIYTYYMYIIVRCIFI